MEYQITHIRLSDEFPFATADGITDIKLSDGTAETIEQVLRYLNNGHLYFYAKSRATKSYVEATYPSNLKAHIKTTHNTSEIDNIINLPRF